MFNTGNKQVRTVKADQPVKLFYAGGFAKEKVYVTAKGILFVVPEPGEYLEVPNFIANDLIRRNRYQGQSVFTKDGSLAKAIIARRSAMMNGKVDAPVKETREQLLARLAELDAMEDEEREPAIPVRENKKQTKKETEV